MTAWLLTYGIHSTILLGCAALVARRLSEQHAWLDQIWKVALIAPVLTASLQLGSNEIPLARQRTVTSPAAVIGPAPAERRTTPPADISTSRPDDASREPGTAFEHTIPASSTRWTAIAGGWPMVVAGSWLLIAGIAFIHYVAGLRRAYRALGRGTPVASADLLDTIARLQRDAGLRGHIRVSTNALCRVPLALSGRRIVLPPRFISELDREQQHAALAHEVAHLVRRDPEWRIATEVLERVLFFQPLNRFARTRLCDSAEFLCDEWAVRHSEPLALARCLSVVASWWTAADTLPAGVSAMARSDSAMVRRVTRILDAPARTSRPRRYWLAIPVALVAVAAPRVTATPLAAPADAMTARAALMSAVDTATAGEQRQPGRDWTAADIAGARAQLRRIDLTTSGASLHDRWSQAIADAGRQRFDEFWIVYTVITPTHADGLLLSDSTNGGGMTISSGGHIVTDGPPLAAMLNLTAIPLEGGQLAVLLHYDAPRANALDRASYRSVQLGFDFGRTPVFWLGDVPEAHSFERVRAMFGLARERRLQTFLIALASLHSDANAVIPFLTSLLDPKWPAEIRGEAAEGFEHHHDPRSVEILLRVARTDADSSVRSDAAEAIGEVQAPQSVPALMELVGESTDPAVRQEAAEAFGTQPADRAIPAIERVIATTQYEDVRNDAIEAIGELGGPAALSLLVQTANTHAHPRAQQEAVETLGDLEAPGVVEALTRIAWEHADVTVQSEAVETLGDRSEDAAALAALERVAREHDREDVQAEAIDALTGKEGSLHPLLLELAVSGRSTRIRREAIETIGDAVSGVADAQLLDRAQAVIERAVFDDPDRAVQVDAIDALEEFPDDRALRILRDVAARHPDARLRREAEDHLRERK